MLGGCAISVFLGGKYLEVSIGEVWGPPWDVVLYNECVDVGEGGCWVGVSPV